jgi:hypothetical protein
VVDYDDDDEDQRPLTLSPRQSVPDPRLS